jgi:hypothetical protein
MNMPHVVLVARNNSLPGCGHPVGVDLRAMKGEKLHLDGEVLGSFASPNGSAYYIVSYWWGGDSRIGLWPVESCISLAEFFVERGHPA